MSVLDHLNYLTSVLSFKFNNYSTRLSNYKTLNIGRTGFRYCAPSKWNKLQTALKLHTFIPLEYLKALLADDFQDICNNFH